MDDVFRALADPVRRHLLDCLYARRGQSLSEICRSLEASGPLEGQRGPVARDERAGLSRQGVSSHLALLEEANLIAVIWRGREKLHYLNPVPINEIFERWIGKYERSRLQALSVLKEALESQPKAQAGSRAEKSAKSREDRNSVKTGTGIRKLHRQRA